MNSAIYHLALTDLLWMLLPVSVVIFVYIRWVQDRTTIFIALFRMVVQLLLIGYLLVYIFDADSPYIVVGVLSVMLVAASVIALRPLKEKSIKLWQRVFVSIIIGGSFSLVLVVFGVIGLDPWYQARFVVPLAGMIFANSMNTVSIAAERYESELSRETDAIEARAIAYKAALIPMINTFFAVGLVSLPGMMTGQILSGVDPLIAVRYQIMVMLMVFGASGVSVAVYLKLSGK